ncbi:MAG: nucleoside triphosphate pyrophosphohydrolase [Planctomycetes bacterium]|nr:nucleoside triphosphate pyrophosphohydrolase [Planctomycetota bacterium]
MTNSKSNPAAPVNNHVLDAECAALRRLLEVLHRLRAPDGCPWDRVQTVKSLAPYLIEESYEALDAIQQNRAADVREELGDVLMNTLMIPMAGETEGAMTLSEVADGIAGKLVRRHPHVFGNKTAADVAEVWKNWENIKKEEKTAKNEDASAIAGVPASLPALFRGLRIVEKAKRSGFRYSDLTGPMAKVAEEWDELRQEIDSGRAERQEEEMGDLLLALVVLASHLSLNPELALRGAVERFGERYRHVENALGPRLKDASLDELRAAWDRAKSELTLKSKNPAGNTGIDGV